MSRKLRGAIGKVFIVGGGPGNPGLLTLKGLACLTRADVVVYDALANPKLLDHAPKKSQKIFVGKRKSRHAVEQSQINALLAKHAAAGKTVCRLKGGDPFLFGRGGEEAEFLKDRGIPFDVVPGVSSYHSVPALAGIPLTHRDYASAVTIATAHGKSGQRKSGQRTSEHWMAYDPKKTLVIMMGFSKLREIARDLIRAGWPKSSAIAVIFSGTLPSQKVITGNLTNITDANKLQRSSSSHPALIVVGDVVRLREGRKGIKK